MVGTAVVVGVLARSWWDILFLSLGDSHDGRINGRFGLHARNLAEDGLIGSGWLSSMEPFSEQAYAHHPPLLNVLQAAVTGVFGIGEWQLHLVGFLAGLATIVALVALGIVLGLRPGIAVVVVAVVAGTPMFWIYARLGLGVSLMVGFLAIWTLAERNERARRLVGPAAGVVAFSSWPGVALVALVVVMGFGTDRARARRAAVGAAAALVIVVVWLLVATTVGELSDYTANRLRSPVGFDDFVEQYRWFYRTLFPTWFRWLLPIWIVVAIAAERSRPVAVPMLVVVGAWTVALPEAAYVHDYWTYPLLVVVALGAMAGMDRLADTGLHEGVIVIVIGFVAVAAFSAMQDAGYRQAYFEEPAYAGSLVASVAPAPQQETAWVVGLELPRWVSFYWDLPVVTATPETLAVADSDDLVLMRLDRLPDWVGSPPLPVARQGRYALVRVGSIASG